MEELNVGDKFKSSCAGYSKSWYIVVNKTTIKPHKTFLSCNFYYQITKIRGKNKMWMGHDCEIQEKITELVRNTIINNYAIY